MSGTRKGRSAGLARESYIIPDAILEDIDGSSSTWKLAVSRLSESLKLPDLGTRHGLKKVHAQFNEICKKLNVVYNAAEKQKNERLMGAVVAIMAKMCTDALLRDKLFEQGILKKILPLLQIDLTRHLALLALQCVAHHEGLPARQEIARHNKTLVKLIRDYPDDPIVARLVLSTVYHSTEAVVVNETPDPVLAREVTLHPLLEITMSALRNAGDSRAMLNHAVRLLVSVTQHSPEDIKAVPSMLSLLVAFTRSNRLTMRAAALGGLIRLSLSANECEVEQQYQFDPRILTGAFMSRTPDHLAEAVTAYGPERTEAYVFMRTTVEYQNAMTRAFQDRDMYALGKKLSTLIQTTEFSIPEGNLQMGDGRSVNDGLPFTRLTDALPLAAKALRARGNIDAADVVDMKFHMVCTGIQEAVSVGHAAIKRNPRLGYAYYVVSMAAEPDEGLPAVKKGLKCPGVTPFLRTQMLWRAVNLAGEQGLKIILREDETHAWEEGGAFLTSAWEDAKTFISEAPPDSRHLLSILTWYILLTIVIRGPELSEDLKELDPARRKMKTSMDFMQFMGYPIKRTELHLTRELILDWYVPGVQEWGSHVKRFDELYWRNGPGENKLPSFASEVAAWFGDIALDDYSGEASALLSETPRHEVPAGKGMGSYELYRCSWCGNPSAVLRKCGGCGKMKYCDSGCQRLHWSEHKGECKGKGH